MPCIRGGREMRDKDEAAKHYRRRAKEVRAISKGIFDHVERKTLMEVAEEYEQLAREAEAK